MAQLFAQDLKSPKIFEDKKYEIKMAPFELLANTYFTTSFEYFKNKDFSYGLHAQLNISNRDDIGYYGYQILNYQLCPYVRYSLSKKLTSFFYLEGFTSLNQMEKNTKQRPIDEFGNGYYLYDVHKTTDLGLGFGVGYKFYIKKALSIDFNLSEARNLLNNNSNPFISKSSILIGYRF